MKLNDLRIRNAKREAGKTRLADGHGLYLYLSPAGGKLWRWKYRFEGREKLMTFGRYPDVTLAKAREKHEAARRLLADGQDPMRLRKEAKGSPDRTFRHVAEMWHEQWKVGKSSRHADYVLKRLKADAFPLIGHHQIGDINPPAVVAMVKAIQTRGAHDIAKRVLETTSQVFRYSIAHGYASRNPAADFKPADVLQLSSRKNFARVSADDLPELLRAIEVYKGAPVTRLAIKLLAHTFVRTSELIHAPWSEFDLPGRRWNIPAERMKMKTPHIVPLTDQAVHILDLLKQLTGKHELLFPGAWEATRAMSNGTILVALRRMGYGRRMTGHGFRGLASTVLHEQGFAHECIELQLAHTPRNAVSAAYNHALYLQSRAKMMAWWSDYLDRRERENPNSPH